MKGISRKGIKTAAIVIIAAGAIGAGAYASAKPQDYHVIHMETQKLEERVEGDGEIKSGDYRMYFSKVTAPIAELNVKEGETVSEGAQLVTYELQDAETAAKLASSQANEVYTKGNAMLEDNERLTDYVNTAFSDYDMASFMVDYFQMYVDYTRDELATYELRGKDVTQVELEYEDYQNKANFMEDEDDRRKWRERTFDKGMEVIGAKEEYLAIDEVTLKKRLGEYETKLSEWKAKKEKYEAHAENKLQLLTPSGAAQIGAAKQTASIQQEDAKQKLALAKEGVIAEGTGVVSEVLVEEGSLVAKGTPLFAVQDTSQKCVEVYLSKYDIGKVKEGQKASIQVGDNLYDGRVTKIYQIAKKDGSEEAKVLTEVTFDKPDEQTYLGLEADVEIVTTVSEAANTLPVEAVYTDDEGDYCYCIQDGIVVKKYITKGISDGIFVEITDGISAQDAVIRDAVTDERIGEKARGVELNAG